LFEGLEIDASIVIGTLLVLAGNLFVLNTRQTGTKTLQYTAVEEPNLRHTRAEEKLTATSSA
jgi:hypothetical protein